MMWIVSRRRHDAELVALRAETARLRGERDRAGEDRDAFKYAAESASEKYTDTALVNERLTEDLTAARNRLAEFGKARTASDVLVEHDVHRKAIADALGDQKWHLNWDQLIAEVDRLNKAATAWMADHKAEKERADRLQAELDDARLLASRLTAAVESRQTLDDQARPADGAALARRDGPSARLRRERDRVRKFEQRLSDMQNSHVADTRELHDLRQKGGTS